MRLISKDLPSKLFLDLMAELLSRGTNVRFRPGGKSMYLSIRERDFITVEPVVPRAVKKQGIFLYRSDRRLIAHRVVEVSGSQAETGTFGAAQALARRLCGLRARSTGYQGDAMVFRLQSDASICCDKTVAARQVLGRVVRVEREARRIALASRGAKMGHKVRRLASGLTGWICAAQTGSCPDLRVGLESLTAVPDQLR